MEVLNYFLLVILRILLVLKGIQSFEDWRLRSYLFIAVFVNFRMEGACILFGVEGVLKSAAFLSDFAGKLVLLMQELI